MVLFSTTGPLKSLFRKNHRYLSKNSFFLVNLNHRYSGTLFYFRFVLCCLATGRTTVIKLWQNSLHFFDTYNFVRYIIKMKCQISFNRLFANNAQNFIKLFATFTVLRAIHTRHRLEQKNQYVCHHLRRCT